MANHPRAVGFDERQRTFRELIVVALGKLENLACHRLGNILRPASRPAERAGGVFPVGWGGQLAKRTKGHPAMTSSLSGFRALYRFAFARRFFNSFPFRLLGRFIDSKVLALLALLDFGRHPARHCTTARPRLRWVLRIAVFGSNLSALHLAGTFARDPRPLAVAKGGELTLQVAGFLAEDAADIVAQL